MLSKPVGFHDLYIKKFAYHFKLYSPFLSIKSAYAYEAYCKRVLERMIGLTKFMLSNSGGIVVERCLGIFYFVQKTSDSWKLWGLSVLTIRFSFESVSVRTVAITALISYLLQINTQSYLVNLYT